MIGRGCLSAVLVALVGTCISPSRAQAADSTPNAALYRCKAANGDVVYTSIAAPGCVVIGTYRTKGDTGSIPDLGVRAKEGWTLMGMNKEEEVRWNPSRTKRGKGWARTWLMFRYFKPQGKAGAQYRKLVAQTYVDCDAGAMTMSSGYWYDSPEIVGGNVVNEDNSPYRQVPPPGTTGDQVIQSLCRPETAH